MGQATGKAGVLSDKSELSVIIFIRVAMVEHF